MIVSIFISLAAIFLLLLITESLWRQHKLPTETSRKIIHMGTGVIIAFWPLYLSWLTIQLLSLCLLVVILLSHHFHIFKSIHSVKRLTKGEILYPVGIGLCALLEPAPWMFTAAILHLALADGLEVGDPVRHRSRVARRHHRPPLGVSADRRHSIFPER